MLRIHRHFFPYAAAEVGFGGGEETAQRMQLALV